MIPFPNHLLDFSDDTGDYTPLFLSIGQAGDAVDAIIICHDASSDSLVAMNEQMISDFDIRITLKKTPGVA